jgi:hypothetical protein
MEQQTQAVAVINPELTAAVGYISKGSDVYQINSTKLSNATKAGNQLIAAIGAAIETPEQVEACKKYIERCKEAMKACNDNRKEITQAITLVTRMFTGIENDLDEKKEGTLPYKVVQLLNAKAQADHEAEVKRKEEERIKLLTEQEKISVTEAIQKWLTNWISDNISKKVNTIEQSFRGLTLDTIDASEAKMQAWSPTFIDYNAYMEQCMFSGSYCNRYLTTDRCNSLFMLEKNTYFPIAAERYVTELTEYRLQLLQRFPGKKEELTKIAELECENAAEAELGRIAAAQREQDRAAAQLKEQQEAREKAAKQVEQAANDERTTKLFDASGAIHVPATAAKVKKVVKVLNKEGVLNVIVKWHTDKAKDMTLEDLQDKFSFCFTHVNKIANAAKPEYIVSPNIEYIDEVKAKL